MQLSSARIFHPVSATATLCLVDPLSVPHPIPEASYQRLVRKHFLSRCTPLKSWKRSQFANARDDGEENCKSKHPQFVYELVRSVDPRSHYRYDHRYQEGRRVISLAGRRTMRSILLSKDLRRENVRRWPRVSKHRCSDGRTARGERGERDCGSSGCEPTKASPRYLNRFTAATISSNSGVSPGANSSGRSGRPAIGAPSGAFSVVSTSNPSFAGELP